MNYDKRDTINIPESTISAQVNKETPNKFRSELVNFPYLINILEENKTAS